MNVLHSTRDCSYRESAELVHDEDNEFWILQLPAAAAGDAKLSLRLIVVGESEIAQTIDNAWLATLESGIHTADVYREGDCEDYFPKQ